jgi:hypothetical protein
MADTKAEQGSQYRYCLIIYESGSWKMFYERARSPFAVQIYFFEKFHTEIRPRVDYNIHS